MNLRATDHPEFDAWRWNDYWVPLDVVIEFKRGVYEMALTELARFLPRDNHHNRYLRAGMRPHHRDDLRATAGRMEPRWIARSTGVATADRRAAATAEQRLAHASTRLSRWIISGSSA